MVMHQSLCNNLWDPQRRLLNISNQKAAQCFTDILLNGITCGKANDRRSSQSCGSRKK
jgi:hypothetical protein